MSKQVSIVLVAGLALVGIAGCSNQQTHHAKTPANPEADMQAYMAAGMPGDMHKWLAQSVGTWQAKNKMWMSPDAPPMENESVATTRMAMDGRYAITEMNGEMPGMGKFMGMGIMGYDNVSKKFVGSWIDNHSSGIMQGTGTLSADKKTMNWDYTFNCPITNKPTVMREVDHFPDNNTMIMEMFGKDPHTGVEYKMMRMEAKRK